MIRKCTNKKSKNFTTRGSNGENANDWVLILDARRKIALTE